ncbi:hypothetical protein [Novosphingobium sediminicola]|uniref:Uncharacterized protein n=1 Tax=Novosphingobium sediminicola TaxID=563162 RepID=A0A7W6CLJ9_9SPHN|nr:hypothetical protein [Novosphingobium sediminicola]MBB3956869.1 hypothetical protein [Novosphingobium sediminicola]
MENQIAIIRAASLAGWLSNDEFREFTQEIAAAVDAMEIAPILRRWKVAFHRNRIVNLEVA